jgi:hypothetical protein
MNLIQCRSSSTTTLTTWATKEIRLQLLAEDDHAERHQDKRTQRQRNVAHTGNSTLEVIDVPGAANWKEQTIAVGSFAANHPREKSFIHDNGLVSPFNQVAFMVAVTSTVTRRWLLGHATLLKPFQIGLAGSRASRVNALSPHDYGEQGESEFWTNYHNLNINHGSPVAAADGAAAKQE